MHGFQDPLQNLKPNYLPDSVSCWPLAFGWWLLIFCIIIFLVLSVIFFSNKYFKNRHRKVARLLIERSYQKYRKDHDVKNFADECNQILKRVAVRSFPKESVLSLYGENWLHFLSKKYHHDLLSEDMISMFGHARYQKNCKIDAYRIYKFTLLWIKKHA